MRMTPDEHAAYDAPRFAPPPPRFADFYGVGNARVAAYVETRAAARSTVVELATYRPNYFAGIVR